MSQFLSTEKIYLLAKATLASAIVFAEPVALLHHHAGVVSPRTNLRTNLAPEPELWIYDRAGSCLAMFRSVLC